MDAHYLASEDEVTSYYNTHADTTFAGLVFDPDNLESDYTLRMNFSSLQLNGARACVRVCVRALACVEREGGVHGWSVAASGKMVCLIGECNYIA